MQVGFDVLRSDSPHAFAAHGPRAGRRFSPCRPFLWNTIVCRQRPAMPERFQLHDRTVTYLDSSPWVPGVAQAVAPAGLTDGSREAAPANTAILIHAFPLNADMWAPQLDAVPAGWRYLAPDLRGFGRSDPGDLNGSPSIDDYARAIDVADRLGVSMHPSLVVPYPGTELRDLYAREGRLLADQPWSLYDTAHVVFQPKLMSVDQLREGYNWICDKAYNVPAILGRGVRTLRRHPVRHARSKLFSSFSTDFGYRRTYSYRVN